MFEDLEEGNSFNVNSVKKIEADKSNGYKRNNFKQKEDELQDPYIPVSIFVDREFPEDAKVTLLSIATKLLSKKITVRINGDDKEFYEKLKGLSDPHLEVFIPWKNFNEIDSKHYFNTITSKHIAETHFQAWDKIPDSVKAFLARNVRMIFGDKNNSITLCLITWSKDGASRISELTKDTGKSSFIIKTAASYGFPVVNISKSTSGNILEKTFGI